MRTLYKLPTIIGLFIGSIFISVFTNIFIEDIGIAINGEPKRIPFELCECYLEEATMSMSQYLPMGITLYALEMLGLFYILRACKFSKWPTWIMMILLLFINGSLYWSLGNDLTTSH